MLNNTNNPFLSFVRRKSIKKYRIADAIYYFGEAKLNLESVACDNVYFDFSDDNYVHLGDVLFFLPLILYYGSINKVQLICDGTKAAVLKYLLDKSSIEYIFVDKIPSSACVITFPYLFHKYNTPSSAQDCVYGVGLAENIPDLPYPLYLARNFMTAIGREDKYTEVCCNYERFVSILRCAPLVVPSFQDLPVGFDVVLLSPYISSGKFRDFLKLKFNKLICIARSKISSGIAICIVGTPNDPPIPDVEMHDLRGVDIVSLLDWARLPNVLHGFGFDNFWMHYFDLIDKPYNVMFRGRYTHKARMIHYNSINIAFCSRLPRFYING